MRCQYRPLRQRDGPERGHDGPERALSAGRVWLGNPPVSVARAVENAVGVESDGAENIGPRSPPPSPVLAVPAALSPVHTGSGDW